jgi:hypothetical protein
MVLFLLRVSQEIKIQEGDTGFKAVHHNTSALTNY